VNSRTLKVAVGVAGVGLVAWFFFAWLALERNVFDAAGESVGSGLLLLVIVSAASMLLKRE
jgi:hypothetical protein